MISFNCQECGAAFRLPDDKAGRKCKCPKCHAVIVIPTPPPQGGHPGIPQEAASPSRPESAPKTPPEKPVEPALGSTASPHTSQLPRLLWFGQAEE
jgi:DNA-directed RNA polymerase subunit RPC12/RpoP